MIFSNLRLLAGALLLSVSISVFAEGTDGADSSPTLSTCSDSIKKVEAELSPYYVYRDGKYFWLDSYPIYFARGWAQWYSEFSGYETRFARSKKEQTHLSGLSFLIEDIMYENTSCTKEDISKLKKLYAEIDQVRDLLKTADKTFVRDSFVVLATAFSAFVGVKSFFYKRGEPSRLLAAKDQGTLENIQKVFDGILKPNDKESLADYLQRVLQQIPAPVNN